MKTIVIFSWFYLPFIGGAELFVKAITDRLGYRYRFVIVTARADRKLAAIDESERVSVVRVGLGNRSDKFMYPLFALKWALASEHVDLVHAIMVNASAVAAYLFSKMKRVPTLLTLQEGDTEDYAREYLRLLFPVYPRLHRTFDRIHAISRFLEQQAITYGADTETIRVIPNGVDTEVFRPAKVTRAQSFGPGWVSMESASSSQCRVSFPKTGWTLSWRRCPGCDESIPTSRSCSSAPAWKSGISNPKRTSSV